MKPDFVSYLQCPARDCNSDNLILLDPQVETIWYKDGPIEEVRIGTLQCAGCGRSYPIENYVLTFEQLFPDVLREEAEYWGKWYGYLWDRGYLSFFDLRTPMAPLLTRGIEILDPVSLNHQDLGGSHSILADHPLLQDAKRLLDVGCGTGWSSLFFKRRGHEVVAFDPSTANMQLAKRYSISQGEYIEYMGAAVGYLAFKPEVFDGILGLHSLHHVPELREEMKTLRDWLRPDGVIGVDEHVRNDPLLVALGQQMQAWAETELYPKFSTLDPQVLSGLPKAEPSSMEGAGSEDVITALLENFTLKAFHARYIGLDHFSFLFYMSRYPDERSFYYASSVIDHLYKFLMKAHPDKAEYVMLIGTKEAGGPRDNELSDQARRLSLGAGDPLLNQQKEIEALRNAVQMKDEHIERLERWAHGMEKALQQGDQGGIAARLRKRLRRQLGMRRK